MTSQPGKNFLPPSTETAKILTQDAPYGVVDPVMPDLARVLARNPKEYTGAGTNTYLLGRDRLWIIDPGPICDHHFNAIMAAIDGRPVDGIFITHTHMDHSPAAAPLKEAVGAKTYGIGPIAKDLIGATPEAIDPDFVPDHVLRDRESVGQGRFQLTAVHTPGHFPNHLCLYWADQQTLFTGDHVMGWSTTVVVPPLGNLEQFLLSLDVIDGFGADIFCPSHGDMVTEPAGRILALKRHRAARHEQILACVAKGISSPKAIVAEIYDNLPSRLVMAAEGQVSAHLELIAAGKDNLLSQYLECRQIRKSA